MIIYWNIGLFEIRASTYISAKLKKTYLYTRITAVTVEMNTRGSKTPTTFIPFHTKYDLRVHSLIKPYFPTLSHGNSYVFYEVANSYEFVRPHLYNFVRFV